MATHIYDDPGPTETHTNNRTGMPPVTHVKFSDGVDHLLFLFTDLDTLDEAVHLLEEARANHVVTMTKGRVETVRADRLGGDELVIIDGELVLIAHVVLTNDKVIVRYSRKYVGFYDDNGDRAIDLSRSTPVKRILPATSLAVV